MEELNLEFNNLIETFKTLDNDFKRKNVILSIKELVAVIDSLAKSKNIDLHYLQNREILDLQSDNVSESDYLEALFVYIEVAKSLVGEYLDKIN